MKMPTVVFFLLAIASFAVLPAVKAQSADSRDSSSSKVKTAEPDVRYVRPTPKIQFHNYLFDTFGPYPILGAAFAAGINQAERTPPEWQQGAEGYGERFGSNFAIAGVSTTTRYGLAKAFGEYTWYPGRYNASDGFRMGNYNLLASAGGNVAIEFLYRGTHSWLSRVHLKHGHGAKGSEH